MSFGRPAPRIRRRGVLEAVAGLAIGFAVAAFPNAPSAADPPPFDHDRTAFPLIGAHARADCESCHLGGRMQGTPRACAACHLGGGSLARTRRPADHIPTSNDCDDCHTAFAWRDARFDHAGAIGSCATCHNGSLAEGKSADHLPTSNRCDDCHDVARWSPARFDHVGITSRCSTCHDGRRASGKSKRHLTTTAACESCHGTELWQPARFDHAEAVGTCESCHNNRVVSGKPPGHIPTTAPCDDCHRTTAWVPTTL